MRSSIAIRISLKEIVEQGQGGSFLADNQSVGPEGPFAKTEKGEGPCVAVFIQRVKEQDLPPAWIASEAWRLHAGTYNDAQEAEFGNAKNCPCSSFEPDGGHCIYSW